MEIMLMMLCISATVLLGRGDIDLGTFTESICREGTVNMTWTPPSGDHEYQLIDLYYTRQQEDGKVYQQITVIDWVPGRGWQVTWNPRRFQGRLRASSNLPTTSFILENVVRIDNGDYELSAVVKNEGIFYGQFTLTVYHEENYFPKLIRTDNSTSDHDDAYTYVWQKSSKSPVTGIIMTPRADQEELRQQRCDFDDADTCEVVFTPEDLTTGTISFDVEYQFPEHFSKCDTLDEPPTNLVIVVPSSGLARGIMASIIVACSTVVIAVCVLVPLIFRLRQKNKYKLSLQEYLEFTRKCIDGIQNYEQLEDLRGIYRRNTPESVIKATVAEYKKKKHDDEMLVTLLNDTTKKDLASCLKYILRTADEEWLPEDIQVAVSQGEAAYKDGSLVASEVRNYFRGSGNKKSALKRELLAAVFIHFDWFLNLNVSPSQRAAAQLLDLNGLARCIAPNFFAKVKEPDQNMIMKWNTFIADVIRNVNEVFPAEDDTGNMADSTTVRLVNLN